VTWQAHQALRVAGNGQARLQLLAKGCNSECLAKGWNSEWVDRAARQYWGDSNLHLALQGNITQDSETHTALV
jgi:hypothetical protein